MSEPRKPSRLLTDLTAIGLLIVLLVGMALIIGRMRRRTPRDPTAAKAPPQVKIDPQWITYREANGIAVPERQIRGTAVGNENQVFISAGFTIYECSTDGEIKRTIPLDNAARCLAIGEDGRIYLGTGDHIEVLKPDGTPHAQWESLGEKAFLTSIAVSGNTLLAGDAGNRNVWRYTTDGEKLGSLGDGSKDPDQTEKNVPSTYFDVASAPDGTFFITDAGRHGVLHYATDGTPLGRWGKPGNTIGTFSGCCNPTHLAVTPDGRIVAVEKKPDLVKVFDAEGAFDSVVAGPKAFTPKTFVADVSVDGNGNILVVDPKKKQVRVFAPKG